MGRKELVLINLAPTSSPCLLTGHLVLHLLLVLVLLHLLLLLLSAAAPGFSPLAAGPVEMYV